MNRILLTLVICCMFVMPVAHAKWAGWQWMKNGKTTNRYQAHRSVVDIDGDFLFTGYFQDSLQLGNTSLTGSGKHLFVAKYSSTGVHQWLVDIPIADIMGTPGALVYDIATDSEAGVYITGMFEDSIRIGVNLLVGQGGQDIFLARFDKEGNLSWAKCAGGAEDDQGTALTVKNDLVYLAGYCSPPAFFDGFTLNSTASQDVFVATYDIQGNTLSAKVIGGDGYQKNAYGIAVDDAGNIYLSGLFDTSVDIYFDTVKVKDVNIGTIMGSFFLLKCTPDLRVQWAKTFRAENGGGSAWGVVFPPRIKLAQDSLIYVHGMFTNCSIQITTGMKFSAATGQDYFMIRYDTDGKALWAKSFAKDNYDYMQDAAVDVAGNFYLMGAYSRKSYFGTDTLYGSKYNNAIVGKYDKQGQLLWLATATGGTGQICHTVAVAPGGQVYTSGLYWSSALHYNQDSLSKLNNSTANVFVGRITPSPVSVQTIAASSQSKVYPNPANSVVNISSSEKIEEAVLLDLNGKQVHSIRGNGLNLLMDIAHVPAGIYMLHIKTAAEVSYQKILVAH